jgi:predicted RNase H-like HicB family nuclease
MPSTAGAPLPPRDEARWFRRPAYLAALRVWQETVTVQGAGFQARLRACEDGGWVVIFPALPQLMTRGTSCQQARLEARAIVAGYLRRLRTRGGVAARRVDQRALPRAA